MFFLSSFLVYSPIVASLGVLAFSQTRYYRTPRELPPLTLAGLAYGGCGAVAVRRGGVPQPRQFGFAKLAWLGYATTPHSHSATATLALPWRGLATPPPYPLRVRVSRRSVVFAAFFYALAFFAC